MFQFKFKFFPNINYNETWYSKHVFIVINNIN